MDLITTVGTSLVTNVINKIRNNPNCNEDEQKALNFYGIKIGTDYYLEYSKNKHKVSIFRKKRKIKEIDVSNLNTI